MRDNCDLLQETKILDAHARGDLPTLVRLYEIAAEEMLAHRELDPGAFLLTQAYVFALDCGDSASSRLRRRLVALGRETEA